MMQNPLQASQQSQLSVHHPLSVQSTFSPGHSYILGRNAPSDNVVGGGNMNHLLQSMLQQQQANANNANPLSLNKDLNHLGGNYSRQQLQM